MGWLRFLSRVAFICNVFFLLSVLLQLTDFTKNEAVISTIAITGYFLAVFVFSPLVNLIYLILILSRRNPFTFVPKWLVISNFAFLLIQIIFIAFLNDTFNY